MKTAAFSDSIAKPLSAPFAALAAAISLGLLWAPSARANTVRLAIVAGHNRGEAQDIPLKYAESDADRFAALLSQIGGLEEDNLFLLKSPTPTLMRYAFSELTKKAKSLQGKDDVVFFFYFSGHGDKGKIKLGNQGFALEELRGLIDSLPAQIRIGVFDACQSGSITHLKGGKTVKPLVLEQETNGKGTILITSSSEDENAQESENLQGSFFTHHWLSGLRGPADLSGDKHVSLMEAYQYAFQKTVVNTEGTTGGIQHPNARFQVDVEGDIVITDLAAGDGGIRFPPETEGHFLVVDRNSVIMAEFQKEPKREIFLALGPGSYTIFKKDGKNLRHAETEIALGQITVFDEKGLKRGTLYASYNKGGENKVGPGEDRNLAQVHPYSFYLGFANDNGIAGNAGLNYSLFSLLALDFRFYFKNFLEKDQGKSYAFRPGIEVHHFASRNFQVSLRAGYNFGYRPGYISYEKTEIANPCFDGTGNQLETSDPRCGLVYREDVWSRHTQVRLWESSLGLRYWIHPRFSLDLAAGFEYGKTTGWERQLVRTQPLAFGLGLHF
ncbi:MAG: peptidase caspase catalytic subunit p20 [Fibrobacteres bacterium]|nr:peptidase caspase catalytic subunit p20 [Fibrobacterota bacterium]